MTINATFFVNLFAKGFSTLLVFIFCFSNLIAQTTYSKVYNIFQAKCANCHGGVVPAGQLDLGSDTATVYANIIGIGPYNTIALSKGDKLIEPGYPHRSFLLRMVNNGLDADNGIDISEGNAAHDTLQTLSNSEIELIRQWILAGAPDDTAVINEQLIIDYYNGMGLTPITPPAPPDSTQGFQLHIGPIFLPPATEQEYFKKHAIRNTQFIDVTRMDGFISGSSHHFALYKYFPNADTNAFFTEGLRLVTGLIDAAGLFYNAEVIAQWQYNRTILLPLGTAFFWEDSSVLDFNYHILNNNPDSILAAEIYLNVYYQPHDNSLDEMLSLPVFYGGDDPTSLYIQNNGVDTTFTINQFYPDSNEIWNIWILQSHTHKLGVDFDVFLRNFDGTKGQKVYEGFFNPDYTFNQGFYEWQHPAVHEFNTLLPINMKNNGLIHEATYNNSGINPVSFGLTNDDEMFVTYMHYTKSPITGIENKSEDNENFVNVYPNPFTGLAVVSISNEINGLQNYEFSIYDLMGREVRKISNDGGSKLIIEKGDLPSGMYFFRLNLKDNAKGASDEPGSYNGKFIVQ